MQLGNNFQLPQNGVKYLNKVLPVSARMMREVL